MGGLRAVEGGGHMSQAPARVLIGQEGQGGMAIGARRPLRRQDGDGAARQGIADEAPAVGQAAGQRGEEEAGLDRTAVRRQSADIEPLHCFVHSFAVRGRVQVGQSQAAYLRRATGTVVAVSIRS